ncbi:acyl carrier protein [Calothrix sp. NIES-4071]|nr:acyl carrier protein [Calothrix sp. NIES-4071]BAZ54951.1 acyl carrier protein [Calothrix sp. NIES-4105]
MEKYVLSDDLSVASYQICKNWLKAREGNILRDEDSQQYQRIVVILEEIVKLTEEIKATIQCCHLKEMEIYEKVRAIVVEKLEIELEKVTPATNFVDDLGTDSLDILELIIALEETFKIEISVQVAQTLLTVQQTIDYINYKIKFTV